MEIGHGIRKAFNKVSGCLASWKNADISVTQVPIIRMYRSVNLFSLGRTVFKLGQFSFNQVAAVQCFGQNAAVALPFAPDLTKNLPLDHTFLSLKPF